CPSAPPIATGGGQYPPVPLPWEQRGPGGYRSERGDHLCECTFQFVMRYRVDMEVLVAVPVDIAAVVGDIEPAEVARFRRLGITEPVACLQEARSRSGCFQHPAHMVRGLGFTAVPDLVGVA